MSAKRVGKLRNEHGLHFRAWNALMELAQTFESEVRITREGVTVDGKGTLLTSLTKLAATGSLEFGTIDIEANGDDAEAAVLAIWELVERGFDEL